MRLLGIILLLFGCAAAASATEYPLEFPSHQAMLRAFEGYHLIPYRDGDHWVVGVGHNLTAHFEIPKSRYTAVEVEAFLVRDLAAAVADCQALVKHFDSLPLGVQQVAISLAFQTGRAGFRRFTEFRRYLSWHGYENAATALFLSRWYRQTQPDRANWAIRVLRSQP